MSSHPYNWTREQNKSNLAQSTVSLNEESQSASTSETKHDGYLRQLSRTPSPTPSEIQELETGAIDWKTVMSRKFWIRKDWAWYYVILTMIIVIVVLMTVYHVQIVHWLTPVATWLRDKFTLGWLVPIAVLFVISFPPLFGHEIVAVLCGVVWGLWAGFGIVAAGSFLGEIGNFYAFKYCCRARGEKLEKSKIIYACLARVVRDGGFKIALIARLSAIPGHFTTAVFSTCGMSIFVFSLAAILSMPKQFVAVYLGVILEQSATGTKDTKSRIISDVVLAVTILITVVAMWYILHELDKVKPQVIYERRKARQTKSDRIALLTHLAPSSSLDVFNPNGLHSDVSLTQMPHQQWDDHGRAVGYVPDPRFIFMPKPRLQTSPFPTSDEEQGISKPSTKIMYPPDLSSPGK